MSDTGRGDALWMPAGEPGGCPGCIRLDDCVGQTVWCLETWSAASPDLDDPEHGPGDDEISHYTFWSSSEDAQGRADVEIGVFRRGKTPHWMVCVTRCTVVQTRDGLIALHQEGVEFEATDETYGVPPSLTSTKRIFGLGGSLTVTVTREAQALGLDRGDFVQVTLERVPFEKR